MLKVRNLTPLMVVTLTLLFGACTGFNFSGTPDDKAITADIQSKLFQDPVLKARDIRVEAQKGVVVLSGSVGTDSEKASVEKLAGQASGVKQVINQLSVSNAMASAPVAATPYEETPPEPAPVAAPRHRAARAKPAQSTRASAASYPSSEPPARGMESVKPAEPPRQAETVAAAVAPAPPPAPRVPDRVTIPAGTVVSVRMIDGIDSQKNHPGEEFAASLEAPVVVGDRVVIQRGADARVRLVNARSAGRMSGTSTLQLDLISLTANGNTYNIESGPYTLTGASRGKRTAETIGGGAGLGALIGAIAGGGKGAAIGAAVGAGAGTTAQAATHGQQVKVPSETKIDFTIKSPVTVTL